MIVEKFDSYEFALVGYWHLNAVWQAVMSACPYLYYNNAKAAKDWMVDVLGFETGFTVEDKDGTIGHAGRPEDEPSIETSIMPASLLWDPHRNSLILFTNLRRAVHVLFTRKFQTPSLLAEVRHGSSYIMLATAKPAGTVFPLVHKYMHLSCLC